MGEALLAQALSKFLDEANESAMGGQDCFAVVAGGRTGFVERVASTKGAILDEMPVGKNGLAMWRYGHLVGRANLGETDMTASMMFVDLGFEELLPR